MATALVFKVRDPIGVLVASCKLLNDAVKIASRHGKGSKIVHMHFGVLATVDRDNCAINFGEPSLAERAIAKLAEKQEAMRQEYERTLEQERRRMEARRAAGAKA